MSEIKTLSIGELVRNTNTPQRKNRIEHFIIPDYQRGYRWDDLNVKALLRDIDDFKDSINSGIVTNVEKYCLQPIVVADSIDSDSDHCWEVIDGQQRLITLYIIINCIGKPCYDIYFDKRGKSTDFIKSLSKNGVYDHSNPDFHFASRAHEIIKKWFDDKSANDIKYIEKFGQILFEDVQVIWYHVDYQTKNEKIDIFNRLNIGKIPLTDAELVKALLLSKIKGDLNPRELNLRQSEISNEWQSIEYELRKPEKWLFLNSDASKKYSSHIELLFDLIAKTKDSKKYTTYLWFEKAIASVRTPNKELLQNSSAEAVKADELWKEIKSTFVRINSWFCSSSEVKPSVYHYVGYLLLTKCFSIRDILIESFKDKDVFLKWLEDRVRDSIKSIDLETLDYNSSRQDLNKVFLLFNILTCNRIAKGQQNRFPFEQYVAITNEEGNGWSFEHIHAQHSQNPIKSEKAIRAWIDETLNSIENINTLTKSREVIENDGNIITEDVDLIPYRKRLQEMKGATNIDVDEFNDFKNQIIIIFESPSVHELSNLALLSKKDNSVLNNSIFPAKRDLVIKLEKEGKFIPPCTRNVFLKFYSESNSQPFYWSEYDKKMYFEEIKNVINSVF